MIFKFSIKKISNSNEENDTQDDKNLTIKHNRCDLILDFFAWSE